MITVKGVLSQNESGWFYRMDFTNPAEPVPQFRSEGYFKTEKEAVKAADDVVKRRCHPVIKIEWKANL